VARFLGHLFLPQPVITIERARKRDREMFAIFLSPDDNDGAREYFITALSHQPDFPAAAAQMPLDARATGKYCTLSRLLMYFCVVCVCRKFTHTD
jgi:hypothetical protein